MTLPVYAVTPPIVLLLPVIFTPNWALPRGFSPLLPLPLPAPPSAVLPIMLPRILLPVMPAPDSRTPWPPLPEMTFPLPPAPMVFLDDPLSRVTPSSALANTVLPSLPRPIVLLSSWLLLDPDTYTPEALLPEMTLPETVLPAAPSRMATPDRLLGRAG